MAGPPLVAFDADNFSAVYISKERLLKVQAKGDISGVVLDAWLQRDEWLGGLKFSLVGYYGGFNPPPSKHIDKHIEEHIALPMPHFNSNSVLIETANATFPIPIRYLGFDSSGGEITLTKQDPIPEPQVSTQVLAPIPIHLPGGQPGKYTARITAPLPSINSSTTPKFDESYLRIWDSGVSGNRLYWEITWEHEPDNAMPQLFDVVTNNGPAGTSGMLVAVQSYVVWLVLLASS